MGVFSYDGPLIKGLTMIANMMMVSFFWLVCCIPLITIVPSCTAMYHTMVKVVRRSGNGIVYDFFSCFKENLRQGLGLSVIVVAISALLFFCLTFGYRNAQHLWVLAYFVFGCLIALIFAEMVIWIPPVLSRFEGGLSVILRLSLYFAMSKPLQTILMIVLLAIAVFLVDFYPVLILLIPAVYVDLIFGMMEKALLAYQKANGLEENVQIVEEEAFGEVTEMSALEQAKFMDEGNEET